MFYITNSLAVEGKLAEEIANNGKMGDARIVLCCAPIVKGGDGFAYYLNTNGGPFPVGAENDPEDIKAAAKDFGMTGEELLSLIKEDMLKRKVT